MRKGKSGEVLMTEGCIWKHIVRFALPLALGYLFQQLYTTVDSIVVGNYVGKEALAAVGTTSPIINTLIGFFSGLATGGSVVIAKNYGAGNAKRVEKAVHFQRICNGARCFYGAVYAQSYEHAGGCL